VRASTNIKHVSDASIGACVRCRPLGTNAGSSQSFNMHRQNISTHVSIDASAPTQANLKIGIAIDTEKVSAGTDFCTDTIFAEAEASISSGVHRSADWHELRFHSELLPGL
jgi:hypothetical protein